jgi:hypothetical protein
MTFTSREYLLWELARSFFQYYFKELQTLFKHHIASGVFSEKPSVHLG